VPEMSDVREIRDEDHYAVAKFFFFFFFFFRMFFFP
jgi:hypothetical protein